MRRPFGNIINDVALKYGDAVSITDLRKLEKLSLKVRKAELDIQFLKNCQWYNVTPKFLSFCIPHASSHDTKAVRKRLLRSALRKRNSEIQKLQKELDNLSGSLRNILSSVDFYMILKAVQVNVNKVVIRVVETHRKKLARLTENVVLPFKSSETVRNLSSYSLTDSELDVLRHGLSFGIEPKKLNRTDIYVTFELIYRNCKLLL